MWCAARNYRGRRPAWTSPWSSSRSRRRAASAPPESDASPPAPDLLADGVLHDNDTMAGGRHPLRGLLGLAARRVAAHADPPYRPAPQVSLLDARVGPGPRQVYRATFRRIRAELYRPARTRRRGGLARHRGGNLAGRCGNLAWPRGGGLARRRGSLARHGGSGLTWRRNSLARRRGSLARRRGSLAR